MGGRGEWRKGRMEILVGPIPPLLPFPPFYRNFKVASVRIARIMPTIQKRVTIFAS